MELNNLIMEYQSYLYGLTKYFTNYASRDDLFQAGAIGLINAYKKYDASLQVKFTTYAFPYIMGEMKKCIRESKDIKLGRKVSKLNLQIEKASLLLSQKLMREATILEISEFLDIPQVVVEEALSYKFKFKSIDDTISTFDNEISMHEIIPAANLDINTMVALKEELESLDEPEKSIIINRYLNDYTQDEVANMLGLSQVQVSRKEHKALVYLRNNLTK